MTYGVYGTVASYGHNSNNPPMIHANSATSATSATSAWAPSYGALGDQLQAGARQA